MNFDQVAQELGCSLRTVQRYVNDSPEYDTWIESLGDFKKGAQSVVPEQVLAYLRKHHSSPDETPSRPIAKKPVKINGAKPSPRGSRKKTEVAREQFGDRQMTIIAAWIIIALDAVACATIVYNSYSAQEMFLTYSATAIGFSAGCAIGYAGFKNMVDYVGSLEPVFLWGFGLFQLLLHLSALGVFDYDFATLGISMFVGKVAFSVFVPLSMMGIATAWKGQK